MGALSDESGDDPAEIRDHAEALIAMISELAEYAECPATDPWADVDGGEVAGAAGQAQENRAIRVAQARFASERARLAREGLHDLVLRARVLTEDVRAQQLLREARLELTGAERLALADLSAVVPRVDRTLRVRGVGVVTELLGHALAIPGISHAGITMWDRRHGVVWSEATSEVGRALAAVQCVSGGPGRDAADTATPVHVAVHTGTLEWGRFQEAASDLGVRAVLSVPVHDGAHDGTLDLLSHRADALDEHARALGGLLGRYAGIALRLLAARGPARVGGSV